MDKAGHEPASEVSLDAWLGGRLTLAQGRRGHRVGSDAALLAAATDLSQGRVVDVGAGIGAVGLAILSRGSDTTADLVEIDFSLAELARANALRNGLAGRTRILDLDIGDPPARRKANLLDETADAVVTNPPFFDGRAVRVSPDEARSRAHVFDEAAGASSLELWIRACLAILRPGGTFVMIHRPEALAKILAAAENRLGAMALIALHPRREAPAHRLLVSAVKGSRAPLRIAPALTLHRPDGQLTPEADAIHRGEKLIDWGL
jgi:tRNA1(Val) A37 N6-methylase TrmN6